VRSRYIAAAPAALLVVLALASCASTPDIPEEKRLMVAVAAVENAPAGSTTSWDDELIARLVKTRRFRVMERAKLEALLQENQLTLSDLGDTTAKPKALAAIGADAVLLAKVTQVREYSGKTTDATTGWWSDVSLGIEVRVTGRLVSVTTSEILAASEGMGTAEAGKFSGAMGESTVDKPREALVAEAASWAFEALARQLARSAPARQ
jgi:curli biogenesis system outer membrane secretion channel CsgG